MEKELKEKYGGLDLFTLEEKALEKRNLSRENQKEFVEILIYLEATKRYKENKLYAKASFYVYIDDRFMLRQATYREMKRAYVKWPEAAIKHGVGLVSKIERKCGTLEMNKVLSEIEKVEEHKPIKREVVEKIIHKHRDIEKEKKLIDRKDWKNLYIREVEQHNKTKEALAEAETKIQELEEQVQKLKQTASVVSRMRKIIGISEGAEMTT